MRIRLSRSIVPNLFTVLNIFFGFLCVVNASRGRFLLAGWYVVLSALCDTLDGFMARLTRSASEFGVELDSLADVVAFGIAPSYLAWALYLHAWGPFGMLAAAAQLIFGALRLARFNVQLTGFSKEYFTGCPIPLSALTQVSFLFFFTPERVQAEPALQQGLTAVILVCSALMVSTVRYPVLPRISPRAFRERPLWIGLLLVVAVAVVASLGRLLFPVLAIVVISGPILALWRRMRRGAGPDSAGAHSAASPVEDRV